MTQTEYLEGDEMILEGDVDFFDLPLIGSELDISAFVVETGYYDPGPGPFFIITQPSPDYSEMAVVFDGNFYLPAE